MADPYPIRVEATSVAFVMSSGMGNGYVRVKDGERVWAFKMPPSYGQIHDEHGEVLPRCEIFFGPFRKTRQRVKMGRSHRRYFGSDHKGVLAHIPDIPKTGWKPVGKVKEIVYVRRGRYAPGGFYHPYADGYRPTLSKNGRLYKISLGPNCLVDSRGYRWP
jgi:hypothetical protein